MYGVAKQRLNDGNHENAFYKTYLHQSRMTGMHDIAQQRQSIDLPAMVFENYDVI